MRAKGMPEIPVPLQVEPEFGAGAEGLSQGQGGVRAHPAAPELLLIEEDLTSTAMAGVYRASDLLVHPYRGEGFGMPVLSNEERALAQAPPKPRSPRNLAIPRA